ncbi:MAG: hypothetical protein K6G47_13860 [Clostridia bacterium]|nr:hypothetical protein [Clostridia bacterium]
MNNYPEPLKPNKPMALTSFILGLFAMLWTPFAYIILFIGKTKAMEVSLFMLFVAPFLEVVMGILGIVFSSVAKKSGCHNGFRRAGFVLSLLDLIFGAIIIFIFLLVILIVGMAYRDIINWALSLWS